MHISIMAVSGLFVSVNRPGNELPPKSWTVKLYR